MDAIDIHELKQLRRLHHRENGKLVTLRMNASMYKYSNQDTLLDMLKRAGTKKEYFKQEEKVVRIEKKIHALENKKYREKGIRTQIDG